jgi:2-polyprenyl-6-methoxyphenol hydroxylase-like FAD-dependent oxidoreductase
MKDTFDALVLGGGPAGSVTALLLARSGWSVAVVERKVFPRRKVCGEYLSATNLPLLRRLGLARDFCERAGPAVTQVGLFAGRSVLRAALPQPGGTRRAWGQALGREHLDTLLLEAAMRSGAAVFQPCTAVSLQHFGDSYSCRVEHQFDGSAWELQAPVVIAAHGSWEPGTLPTQSERPAPTPSELFGFKAHFTGCDLKHCLMPLLAFPGGYGGMVHTDSGRVSLSLCIRRDCLTRLRHAESTAVTTKEPDSALGMIPSPISPVGDVVLQYIMDCCAGVRHALAGATRKDGWLATGPIRPGVRLSGRQKIGLFSVGNAAGEAHPVVAEGISMALQAGWLLSQRLIAWSLEGRRPGDLRAVSASYIAAWQHCFAPRLHASAVVAHWAMHPGMVAASLPLLHCWPHLLSWGARLSGKATRVVSS